MRELAPRRARGAWVVVALLALGGLAAAGFHHVVRGGTLRIELAGGGTRDAQVLVDGVERCAALPCLVEGLDEGVRTVRVSAEGHVPSEVAITLGARADERLTLALERAR